MMKWNPVLFLFGGIFLFLAILSTIGAVGSGNWSAWGPALFQTWGSAAVCIWGSYALRD